MDNMTEECRYLQAYLNDNIPLTNAVSFKVAYYDGQTIKYEVPLNGNHNDKGTGFAGSIFAAGILTAWGFANMQARSRNVTAEIVASNANIAYKKPVQSDFRTECTVTTEEWDKYFAKLAKRKNATLTATVNVWDNIHSEPCAILTAEVFAYIKRDDY